MNDMPTNQVIEPELFRKGVATLRDADHRSIGMRLRHERERLGYTVDEVAIAMGCYPEYIEGRERAGRPSVNLLFWLALAGADVSFILAGDRCRSSKLTALIDALRAALG